MREGWARQEWYAELHEEVKAADDLARHRAASKKRREGSVRCAPALCAPPCLALLCIHGVRDATACTLCAGACSGRGSCAGCCTSLMPTMATGSGERAASLLGSCLSSNETWEEDWSVCIEPDGW